MMKLADALRIDLFHRDASVAGNPNRAQTTAIFGRKIADRFALSQLTK